MAKVTIIGGGIGGLAFANALQLHGIDFDLFEQAPALTEVGAALGLSKVALDILQEFNLINQVREAGSIIASMRLADKNLNVLRDIPPEVPAVVLHRARLIDILSSTLPKEKIHLNKKLIALQSEKDFSLLRFSDGSEIKSDCVAVADGLQSFCRKQLFPEVSIRYAGQAIWRGITEMQLPENHTGAFTEIWDEAKRFLFVPMGGKSVCWLAIQNAPVGGQDDPQTVRAELLKEYESFHPLVKELLSRSSNFIRNDLADLANHNQNWYHHKIVFLGDSIHATTPNLAQGACQAIEDSYCLSWLMQKQKRDFSLVYPTYQKIRAKKVSLIVSKSWQLGKMAHSNIGALVVKAIFKYAPNRVFLSLEKKLNDVSYLRNH